MEVSINALLVAFLVPKPSQTLSHALRAYMWTPACLRHTTNPPPKIPTPTKRFLTKSVNKSEHVESHPKRGRNRCPHVAKACLGCVRAHPGRAVCVRLREGPEKVQPAHGSAVQLVRRTKETDLSEGHGVSQTASRGCFLVPNPSSTLSH